jgi:hypothetical protein
MANLLQQSTRTEIIERINRLSPDAQAQWGKMNVNQMLCHVTDQLRVSLGDKKAAGGGGASLFGRTILKFLVLNVIPIPRNVPTSPAVDQLKDGTPPTDFASDKKTLLEYIEKFAKAPEDFSWSSHFKFGPLNKKEWAALAAKHLDHHLKQFGA